MQFLGILAVVVALFLLVSAYPTAAVIIGAATVLTILAFRLRVRRPAARVSAPSPAQRYQRIKSFGTSDLRATDDDRELTTDVLTGALRNGSLTVAEYSDRCGTAGAAHLRQQLFTCVRDLDF